MEAAIPLSLSFPSSPSFFFCICVLNLWSSPSSVYNFKYSRLFQYQVVSNDIA